MALSNAERQARYRRRKHEEGKCPHPGCWKDVNDGRYYCDIHSDYRGDYIPASEWRSTDDLD